LAGAAFFAVLPAAVRRAAAARFGAIRARNLAPRVGCSRATFGLLILDLCRIVTDLGVCAG
jgi:hypothetical protein